MSWGPEKAHPSLLYIVAPFLSDDSKSKKLRSKMDKILRIPGIPAPKVLQLATLGAARVVKRDTELGSIAPGKLADVILVDGDPTAHISDIRRVKTVVKDGVVFQVADMDKALGVIPAK